MGCLLVIVPLQGGGRTLLRVAELHWSTCNTQLWRMAPRSSRHCNGHTPGDGVDPPAELRQGNQLGNGRVIAKGRWGSLATRSSSSRRWKTLNQNPEGVVPVSPKWQLPRGREILITHQPPPLELVVGLITLHRKNTWLRKPEKTGPILPRRLEK